ncbi:MAG: putative DNA-binding domain-containing protein [Woeseia sp.]
MADIPAFQKKQYAFAAHIRNPEQAPAPDAIEDRRMAIYRELFFNNLFKLLGSTFPVLKTLYGDNGWRRLVRAFMSGHQAQTPYFLEIPKEFIAFLQDEYELTQDDPPFLIELAHYEWAELALSVSDESNDLSLIDGDGDLLHGVPIKSVLAWTLAYQFPVHRIDAAYQPDEAPEQATFLSVYRKDDDELGFMELNPVTARLLELIADNPEDRSGRDIILGLAQEIGYSDHNALLEHGAVALQDMRAAGILLGTVRNQG